MSEDDYVSEEDWDDWFEPTMDYNEITGAFKKEDTEFYAIAILSLVIGLFGLAANFQIFSFYWSRRRDLVPSLYIALSFTDFVCSFTAVIHFIAIVILINDRKDAESLRFFLTIVFCITTLVLRISVFVNVQLIVVRTINIKRPFYQVNQRALWISLGIVLLILVPIIIYDAYWIKNEPSFYEMKVRSVFLPYVGDFCIRDLIFATMNISKSGRKNKTVAIPEYVTFATSCAPFIVAVLIAVTCLVVNYLQLRSSSETLGKSGARSTERDVTITITILTVVFSVCNTVYSLWIVLMWVNDWDYWENQTILQLSYTTSTLFPFVSSSLNAFILILRSKALKHSLLERIRGFNKPRGSQTTSYSGQRTEISVIKNNAAENSI